MKACYASSPKLDLKKFMRYPTEMSEMKSKSKFCDKSFRMRETEMKENEAPMKEKHSRKRRTKEELIFMQIKRH